MTQNVTVSNSFSLYFQQYKIVQNQMNKIVSTYVSTLAHFKNSALLYSRVGAGAGDGAA
jgi:uncharacterized protein (DUF39 family)